MTTRKFPLIRGFLFDLDGTLIDSKVDLVDSVNFMRRELQREPLPVEIVASYIGHGAPRPMPWARTRAKRTANWAWLFS